MADNPILDFSDTVVYERDRLPRVTSGEDIAVAAEAVAGAYQAYEFGKFEADLEAADDATLEAAASAEAQIDDVVEAATKNEDPEFAEAVRQLSKFQLMKDQGIGDSTAVNVRREHVLRKWTARHPDWAPDLLRAANEFAGGSTLGEAIARTRGPANPMDDVETHARQLGVDMTLRFSDPVAFSVSYLKAQKAEGKLKEAQRTLQLLQTEQNTLKTLNEGAIQQIFDATMGEMVSTRINQFSDQILAMADSPDTAGEAERLNAIRQAARAERSAAVAFVTRQSGGLISTAEASSRVAQIAQLDAIIDAANPAELSAVVAGIKAVREAEIEGWYAAHPGAAVAGEKLRILGQLGNNFPGLVQRKEQLGEAARLSAYFLNMDDRVLNTNATTGVNIPRRDSLGITQDSTAAARSTYNATTAAVANYEGMPAEADRHMLNLADSWAAGERPAKRTIALARSFMASDKYRDVVASSPLNGDAREDRAAKITNMLVGEFADDMPKNGGRPLKWAHALSGLKWVGDRAEFEPGRFEFDMNRLNAEVGPTMTEMVKAIAHGSGISYEDAASRLWTLIVETF